MHSYFVYDINEVDEDACRAAAMYRYEREVEQSIIHFHRNGETCNEKCYIVPQQVNDAD